MLFHKKMRAVSILSNLHHKLASDISDTYPLRENREREVSRRAWEFSPLINQRHLSAGRDHYIEYVQGISPMLCLKNTFFLPGSQRAPSPKW